MSRRHKTAVVLSGGGAEGAYQVGILKALVGGRSPATGYKPLEPDIFAGTSIGSLNAAFLTAQWDEYGPAAVANLERLWVDRLAEDHRECGNGLYRLRADPFSLANPGCYIPNPLLPFARLARDGAVLGWEGLQRTVHVATADDQRLAQRLVSFLSITSFIDMQPFLDTLRETIDYRAIRDSRRRLRIIATNWATGELKIFENPDMTDDSGPVAILASAAVPGFFPPAEFGSQPFVDGSVLLNTPLKPAIRAGARELHVIYMDPDIRNIPLAKLDNTVETFYRMQQIRWAAAINDDISDAETINQGLAVVRRLKRGAATSAEDAETFVKVAGRLEPQFDNIRYRPLTIRRYNPRDPLGGELGFFNLNRTRVEALIERGFQDAVQHDAKASHDILAEPDEEETDDA